jgi:predicted nucleic acid-binding Zn ribbon protein
MDNINDIVKNVIGNIAGQKADQLAQIEKSWVKILTQDELRHTKIKGIKEGSISVNVDSPAWMFQMKTKKNRILKKLQEDIFDVKNIFFRIGKINE